MQGLVIWKLYCTAMYSPDLVTTCTEDEGSPSTHEVVNFFGGVGVIDGDNGDEVGDNITGDMLSLDDNIGDGIADTRDEIVDSIDGIVNGDGKTVGIDWDMIDGNSGIGSDDDIDSSVDSDCDKPERDSDIVDIDDEIMDSEIVDGSSDMVDVDGDMVDTSPDRVAIVWYNHTNHYYVMCYSELIIVMCVNYALTIAHACANGRVL